MPAAHTHTHKVVEHGNLLLRMLHTHEDNDRRMLHDVLRRRDVGFPAFSRHCCCCYCCTNRRQNEHNIGAKCL